MMKIKSVLPSLREKKRYLAFEVVSKNKIGSFTSVSRAVWQSMLALTGELGAARAGLWLLPDCWNGNNQKGIARASTKGIEDLKASITLINSVEQQPVVVRSIATSGMLNKVKKAISG
jgi:ribonuclease P/MRP protein subunit POP5